MSFEPLRVDVVGAGAVGLSLGVLLTMRGHSVSHRSLRRVPPEAFPVHAQIGRTKTRSIYRPRFAESSSAPPDVEIFAVSPSRVPLDARQDLARTGASATLRLVVASVFIAEWQAVATPMPTLLFPLMSCEYCPRDGLSLRTDHAVEVLASDNGSAPASPIIEALGFRVAAHVGEGRFFARYLQTAAIYAVIAGVSLGIIGREALEPGLLMGVFAELHTAATAAYPKAQYDFPVPVAAAFAAVTPLIVAAVSSATSNDVLIENLRQLLSGDRRKLDNHLAPFKTIWTAAAAHRATPAQALLGTLLSRA